MAPPLDVLIQDPTTNLLELFLYTQNASAELVDQLYATNGRHRTTGLTLLIHPGDNKNHQRVELSEWLAEAHLEEYRQKGWLIIDSLAPSGEFGRGTSLRQPNGEILAPIVVAVAQILAKRAPQERSREFVRDQLLERFDESLIPDPDRIGLERLSSCELKEHPGLKVFSRSSGTRGGVFYKLKPPYAVVLKDAARELRQASGSGQ